MNIKKIVSFLCFLSLMSNSLMCMETNKDMSMSPVKKLNILQLRIVGSYLDSKDINHFSQTCKESKENVYKFVNLKYFRNYSFDQVDKLRWEAINLTGENLIKVRIIGGSKYPSFEHYFEKVSHLDLGRRFFIMHLNSPNLRSLYCLSNSKNLKNIEYLDLTNNPIQDEELNAFIESKNFPQLKYLNLSCCQVKTKGAEIISKSKYLNNLYTLILTNNEIGEVGARAIINAKIFSKIKKIDFSNNPIGEQLKSEILKLYPLEPK